MAEYRYLTHTAAEIDQAIEDEKEHTADTVTHTCAEEKAVWNGAAEQAALSKVSLGVQCKNLLQNNCASVEVQGVALTINDDGSITLNGTNTGSSVLAYPNMQTGATSAAQQYDDNKKWVPTGKYIMSLEGNNGGATLQMRCATEPSDAGTGYTTTTETAVEVTDEHNYVWNRLLISSGASFDNVTVYPMLRPAEVTDSTYKPYKPPIQEQLDAILARLEALEGGTA